MPTTRKTVVLCLAVAMSLVVFGSGASELSAQTVVASTSLTGALANAAGATEVRILTPPDVKHPPEYELKPSDIAKFDGASAVVYAGYERMVQKLVEVSKSKGVSEVRVDTTTFPENLIAQARKIAGVLHTEKAEEAWEKGFLEKLAVLKEKLAPYAGKKAVVHLQAQGFTKWAGLSVVRVIMPGEISPKAVADAIAKQPDVVVDILHMPVAKIISENARYRYVQLINFPGVDKTATLEDVFEYDTAQIVRAFQQEK
jgi:zinc transport system substrate-binding protein/iron/zinc/copper transport system substrate-binding protein